MSAKKKKGLWIGRVFFVPAAILLLAFLYLTLIVGQPQAGEKESPSPQPLLTASPALNVSSENELYSLIASFPVPVMSCMSGSGLTFVSAASEDRPWKSGFGRIASLYWQTAEGLPLILQSIYPAEALDLMGKGDYSFSGTAGPTLFGQPSVRMENADTVRVHTVTDSGIYVLTVPRSLSGSLSVLSRSVQLFTVEQ